MQTRPAARTVLINTDNQVAIIHVAKDNYYKIPGGGIETDESPITAAQREALEESGCQCRILADLGQITINLPGWDMRDASYGFLAQTIGDHNTPNFEDHEKSRGFQLKWFPSLTKAIHTISTHTPDSSASPEILAIQARDLAFLQRAADYLGKKPPVSQGL